MLSVTVREWDEEALMVAAGDRLRLQYGFGISAFGLCLIGRLGEHICWLQFVDGDEGLALSAFQKAWPEATLCQNDEQAADLVAGVFSAVEGGRVSVLLRGTRFQRAVWRAVINVPPGRVVTYGELAHRIGQPRATRAVARALAANPVSYLVPCHRVIARRGLGGYSGGFERKRALLEWERALMKTMSP